MHGVAYDSTLETCPRCASGELPLSTPLMFPELIFMKSIIGESRAVVGLKATFYLPLALPLDDGTYELYPGLEGFRRVTVAILWVPREGPPSPPGHPRMTSDFRLHPDRRGLFSFSAITLRIDFDEPIPAPPDCDNFKILHGNVRALALIYTNRLIEVCRHIGGHYHLFAMNPSDLVVFNYHFVLEDGEEAAVMAFGTSGEGVLASGRPLVYPDRAREALLRGEPFPFWDVLYLNAQDSLSQRDWRLCRIEAILALECFLTDFIHAHLDAPLGPATTQAWLEGSKRGRSAMDMIDFIYQHLRLLTPRPQARAWVKRITESRQVLIHARGRPPQSVLQLAPRCVEALKALISAFQNEVPVAVTRR